MLLSGQGTFPILLLLTHHLVFACRFGVVCAFVTNEYMEDGTQKLPARLRTSINDTRLYLSNTQEVNAPPLPPCLAFLLLVQYCPTVLFPFSFNSVAVLRFLSLAILF
jgi:hypothetical protein